MNNSHNLNTSEVPSTFVNGIVESMYGKDSMGDIKAEETPDNDATVTKHAESMGDTLGIPQNIGNAWKAPAQINDHQEVDSETESLTESESPNMESRVSVLEESLVTLLESVKTLVGNINEAEGNVSMNPGKKFIEKREKLDKKPKTVEIDGETVDVAHVTSGLADTPAGRAKKNELEMRATAQELDKKKPRNKKGQALSKKEMAELTSDYKKKDEEGEEEES